MVYDLYCPIPDVVHSPYPQHLIMSFKLLGHTLTLRHLFRQQEQLLLCLLVYAGKVAVLPIVGQQLRVQSITLLFDVSQMPLPPNSDGLFFFGW